MIKLKLRKSNFLPRLGPLWRAGGFQTRGKAVPVGPLLHVAALVRGGRVEQPQLVLRETDELTCETERFIVCDHK